MSIGAKWLRRAEQVAAARIARVLDSAEQEVSALLPGARIERGVGELRIAGRRLVRRWLSNAALRFLLRRQR